MSGSGADLRRRRNRTRIQRLEPPSSEITPASLMLSRRAVTKVLAAASLSSFSAALGAADSVCDSKIQLDSALVDDVTPLSKATGYNNYAEFSSDKEAVRVLARELTLSPWTLTLSGEVNNPLTFDVREFADVFCEEERIYRFRCVEGWAMVVPWRGIALADLLRRADPTSRAKYVVFESLLRPSEMIGQRRGTLEWPYREGLRIDEAMNPLTLLATGFYDQDLAPQNGGPVRLVVPWKYGFKSAKAITTIRLVEHQPTTSWSSRSPSEYGFYGNVNPAVPHPRWTQARENRLGELKKRPTLPFNGYGDHVADLYQGMDPRELY